MKRLGCTLVFAENVTREQAEKKLAELAREGFIDQDYYRTRMPTVHEYDDTYGGPVWYIP